MSVGAKAPRTIGSRDREREAVLCLLSARRPILVEPYRIVERLDLDMLDGLDGDPVGPLERERGLDGRLSPAADRIWLEIHFEDAPPVSEVAPERGNRLAFDHECRRASEAVSGEVGGAQTHHRAPPGSVLDHRWEIDAAHHLTAWTVVLSDA